MIKYKAKKRRVVRHRLYQDGILGKNTVCKIPKNLSFEAAEIIADALNEHMKNHPDEH